LNIHDAIFFLGAIALTISLVPAARGKTQIPLVTASVLTLVIAAFAVNYGTMTLYWSAAVTTIQAGLWGVIAWRSYQVWRFERRRKRSWYASWSTTVRGWHSTNEQEQR
jgi:hypothetical protein